MFTLTGNAPDGDTPREIDFDLDGDRLRIHIHPPDNARAGESIVLNANSFREAVRSTEFTLSGTSAYGEQRQIAFSLRQDMNICITPAGQDEDGWEVDVNMDQLRNALVYGGLVPDTKPEGISISESAYRRPHTL
jgi:hypothetical protein